MLFWFVCVVQYEYFVRIVSVGGQFHIHPLLSLIFLIVSTNRILEYIKFKWPNCHFTIEFLVFSFVDLIENAQKHQWTGIEWIGRHRCRCFCLFHSPEWVRLAVGGWIFSTYCRISLIFYWMLTYVFISYSWKYPSAWGWERKRELRCVNVSDELIKHSVNALSGKNVLFSQSLNSTLSFKEKNKVVQAFSAAILFATVKRREWLKLKKTLTLFKDYDYSHWTKITHEQQANWMV